MALSGYTQETWAALKAVDIRTVDRESLVDIRDVTIDAARSKQEKALQFITQIKNPYCYKHGKFIVKVKFADDAVSLEERLLEYIRAKC